MKTSAYAASVAAALCLAVAGCSSDDEPGASSPTPTPSSTVTSDAPPAPPELPAAATKKTAAGAEAFVKYYWAVVHFSEVNGSVDQLSSISTAECEPCRAGIDNILKLVRGGGSIEGGRTSVSTDYAVMKRQSGLLTASVSAVLREQARVTSYGPSSSAPKKRVRSPASLSEYIHLLFWIPGKGWMLGHLGPA